jgi:MFS family permease
MAALGPVAGGLLVAISWRWVFFANIPFGLAVLVVGWMRLPHVRGERIPYPDALGAALVTAGVALLTLGLVKGDDWGWGSTQTIGVLAASVAVIGSFVLHCLHHRNPLVDPGLFRRRSFTGASVVATLFQVAFGGFLLSLVLWDQNVWHWSALHTGLTIAPSPFLVLPTALLLAERLIKRFGSGVVIAIGASFFATGMLWFALFAGLKPDYLVDFFPGLVLIGVGVGLTLPTMMASATSELSPENFATGSAVVNMLRQVGLAIGVAVLVAVLGTPGDAHAALDAVDRAWLVAAAFAGGALASLAILGIRRPAPHAAPTGAGRRDRRSPRRRRVAHPRPQIPQGDCRAHQDSTALVTRRQPRDRQGVRGRAAGPRRQQGLRRGARRRHHHRPPPRAHPTRRHRPRPRRGSRPRARRRPAGRQ